MLLPILGTPRILEKTADAFKTCFSHNQFKRFKQYLTGLLTGGKTPTISSIARRLTDPVDQSSLNRFLTTYAWNEMKLNMRRIQYLQEHEETKWKASGVIDIDDTLREKTGKDIPGVAKFYDHSEDEYKLAQNLITASYTDGDVHYPIDMRLYFKKGSEDAEKHGFKTKIELAMELVDECEKMGTPAQNYVFDSWFLSEELAEHIESYGKHWLSRLKSNRNVYPHGEKMHISEYRAQLTEEDFHKVEVNGTSYWVHLVTLKVSKLGKTRVLISHKKKDLSDDPYYLATDHLGWEEKKILRTHDMRWDIETFFKDANQHLGLGACRCRSLKATKRHWTLVLLAYSLLRLKICGGVSGEGTDAETIGEACRSVARDLVSNLVRWVRRIAEKLSTRQIFDVVLRRRERVRSWVQSKFSSAKNCLEAISRLFSPKYWAPS